MPSDILQQLSLGNLLSLLLVILVGGCGGLIYRVATPASQSASFSDPGGPSPSGAGPGGAAASAPAVVGKWWQSALIGIVASIGIATYQAPTTLFELVGRSALAGFFGHSLLAALGARVALALSQQQADRAISVASDAIDLAHRTASVNVPANAAGAPNVEVAQLRGRLADVRPTRRV